MTAASLDFTAENLLRDLAPQVLGAVVRRFGDFSAAEDAVQEALLAAALQWPKEGLPDNPRGWLIQVAARRMTDHVRADVARRRRETTVVSEAGPDHWTVPAVDSDSFTVGAIFGGAGAESIQDQDDTLILLFMCCHPALTRPSAIALTLRAVGGLTTAEIANAFLVPEATMAQRISRAKQKIKSSGVPFRMPTESERDDRLSAVLHVLYLIFNEGYTSSSGPSLQRTDLSSEAIRSDPRRAQVLARRWRGRGTAGVDAADRCAARGADGERRRTHSARGTGSVALGSHRHHRRRRAHHRGADERRRRRLSASGRDSGRP